MTPTATAQVSPTSAPADTEGESDQVASDVSANAWWLLAALALGLAVGVLLLVRSRRRRTWRSELARLEEETAWLARDLVPELRRSGSRDQVAGGWAVSSARVRVLEDSLTALQATSPDGAGRVRTADLRDAVRAARSRIEALVAPGSEMSVPAELDRVANDIEEALRPVDPGSHSS